jgi:hypothetical protein
MKVGKAREGEVKMLALNMETRPGAAMLVSSSSCEDQEPGLCQDPMNRQPCHTLILAQGDLCWVTSDLQSGKMATGSLWNFWSQLQLLL